MLSTNEGKDRSGPPRRISLEEKLDTFSAQQLALHLPPSGWICASWHEGSKGTLTSLFAAVPVLPADHHRGRGDHYDLIASRNLTDSSDEPGE
jgi:hypothetical protein